MNSRTQARLGKTRRSVTVACTVEGHPASKHFDVHTHKVTGPAAFNDYKDRKPLKHATTEPGSIHVRQDGAVNTAQSSQANKWSAWQDARLQSSIPNEAPAYGLYALVSAANVSIGE